MCILTLNTKLENIKELFFQMLRLRFSGGGD